MSEEIKSRQNEDEDLPRLFAELLKSNRISVEIDYTQITNPIQLKRIQNSTTQIDGYIENLWDVHEHLEKAKQKFSNKKISEEEYLDERAVICEDTFKNVFEIIALLLNIAENQQANKRKTMGTLISSIFELIEKLKNKADEIFDRKGTEAFKEKAENFYNTCKEELNEIQKLIRDEK